MFQAIADFFNSDNFMAHGHCFLWQPDILWLHVLSDAGIVAAYYSIPFALLYFVWKRKDLPFQAVFLLFGAFILLCGTTHLMGIWVLWHPDYAVEGMLKALTAVVSIATFFFTIKLIPQALRLPSPAQLAAVNKELQDTNRKLEILYEQSQESGQARLHAVVDHALDGLITVNERGIIESFNPACERIFGYKAAEVIGQNIKILMPERYHREYEEYISRFVETGSTDILTIPGHEVSAIRKDGTIFPADLSISVFTLADGKHFSGMVRDITDRKSAEMKVQSAHKFLEDMLNHIPDPIFMKDREHRWIGGNKAFWEIMNGPPEKFLGKSDYEFFPKSEADVFWERDNKVLTSGEVDINEEFFTDANGHKHVFSTKKVAFLNEEGENFLVGVIRDITEIKEAEAQRKRYMQELERSNQELDDFAYIASHDLKEPLRGLFNHASFLIEDYKDTLGESGMQRLHRLSHLAQRMEHLVNDLLYFSRLGRTNLAVQNCDPGVMIHEIQEMMESTLKERNARIVIPSPMPQLVCDRPRITEVFRNLITNAIKYNDKPEPVVEVGFLESVPEGDIIRKNVFFVKDNGIGIEPEFHEEIFRIFKRLQAPVGEKEMGTGVGLTFVKKIIERHRGHIWLESQPGKGTTFYFTLS